MDYSNLNNLFTSIGVPLTFAVGVANFFITWRSNKKTAFVNSVTAARMRWMDSLRIKITEFCKTATALVRENSSKHSHKKDILYQMILLKLLLNRSDEFDIRIMRQMEHIRTIVLDPYKIENGNLMDLQLAREKVVMKEIDRLVFYTQDLLKLEWEGVKEESIKGNLTKEHKRDLYDQYLRGMK